MAAKPSDIRIIREDTREPDYSASYPDPISPLLIKLQTFFSFSFLYPVPADVGKGISESSITGMVVCNFRRI
jgi:hypothetical protein